MLLLGGTGTLSMGVLKEALESKEPVLIDYRINCDKKVFPMVAPGAPISEIITEEDLEK